MRLLGEITSSPEQQQQQQQQQPVNTNLRQTDRFDSDIVVILSALLCAVICVLGLFAAARCTWLRRFSAGRPHHPPPPPPPTPPISGGLDEKVLKSLPKATFGPQILPSDCAICLADYAGGEEVRVLPHCGHVFHVQCIDKWLGSHPSCPSCRRILVSSPKCACLPQQHEG